MIEKNVLIDEINAICTERDVPLMDAIILWCDKNSVEIELVAPLIKKNANMRDRLRIEAEDLNFLKKEARLPV